MAKHQTTDETSRTRSTAPTAAPTARLVVVPRTSRRTITNKTQTATRRTRISHAHARRTMTRAELTRAPRTPIQGEARPGRPGQARDFQEEEVPSCAVGPSTMLVMVLLEKGARTRDFEGYLDDRNSLLVKKL